MTYPTTTAPADADFIGYKHGDNRYVIATRTSFGVAYTCANCDQLAYSIFIAGVSANRKSFWDADAGQFLTGTVEQLTRGVEA